MTSKLIDERKNPEREKHPVSSAIKLIVAALGRVRNEAVEDGVSIREAERQVWRNEEL